MIILLASHESTLDFESFECLILKEICHQRVSNLEWYRENLAMNSNESQALNKVLFTRFIASQLCHYQSAKDATYKSKVTN